MQNTNNKVLITGGFGYIGSKLIDKLIKKGFHVIVNDICQKSFISNWTNRIEYIQDDICELNCPDVDFIVHLAAEVGYLNCDKKSEIAIRTNIDGTKRVASFNKPTLFFSSGSVYGKLNEICTENSPCNPSTLYSKTKKEGEEIIKSISSYCIVRPATAFGISPKMRDDLLMHDLCKTAIEQQKLLLYQPDAMRTMYYLGQIGNFVEYCLCNWKDFSGEIFNLGHKTGNLSKRELVSKISKYTNFDLQIINQQDPDQRDYQVDYSKLESVWGSNKMENLDNNIRKIVHYYKNR